MSIQFLDDMLEQAADRIMPSRCGRSEPRALMKSPQPSSNILSRSGMGEQDELIAIDAPHPPTHLVSESVVMRDRATSASLPRGRKKSGTP